MRRDSTRAVANDAEGHELRINDNVKEMDGLVCISFILQVYPSKCYFVSRDEKDGSFISTSHSMLSYTIEMSQRIVASLLRVLVH